jgi:hypothetical protein
MKVNNYNEKDIACDSQGIIVASLKAKLYET